MASEFDLQLGKRIRRRRTILGLSQVELAEKAGMRFQQIQKYECAHNRVMPENLSKIAEALGVPVGYLFGEVGNVATPKEELPPVGFMRFLKKLPKLEQHKVMQGLRIMFPEQEDGKLSATAD